MRTSGLPVVPTEDVTATPFGVLRWRAGRQRHRPAGERIRPEQHGVELLERRDAADFVQQHHYSRSYPAARLAVGLYREGLGLAGVAVFARGQQDAAVGRYAPGLDPAEAVELSRLVLLDEVEGNGETWFLARAFRALRAELPEVRLVLSYSDPVIRRRLDGTALLPGHVGVVYQGLNATYHGRGKRRRLVLTPDGEVVPERAFQKLVAGERGAVGFYERLVAWGAPRLRIGEDVRSYLDRALTSGPFRVLPHPGNHVYSWALDPSVARVAALPYPRKVSW